MTADMYAEQMVHTYDVMGCIVWQPYLIYLKTYKKIFFSRTAGQIEGKLHTNVPQAMCVQVSEGIIDRSHGLADILD